MPGIAGYTLSKSSKEKRELLEVMLERLKHKEWQKKESYRTSFVHVGRVHLGIYNPQPQPVFNETHELFAFIDGKLYDSDFHINRLKKKGHHFVSENDPEFCLHAYEQYGKNFVQKLNGSFLLVIGDIKNRRVLILNDRFGTMPLYYAERKDGVVFASEVKAILEDKSLKKEINEEALADFFVLGKVIGDKTFFKRIKALPPASILISSKDDASIDKYWEFVYNHDGISKNAEKSIVNQLVKTFRKSVAKRLKNPYRYACALSGGLDSRAVLSAVPKTEGNKIVAFTFGDHLCDEIKVARQVASALKIRHREIEYEPSILTRYFEEVVHLTDGMDIVSVSFMPYAYACVRKFADISLDGFALDLFLGGSFLDPRLFTIRSDSELTSWLYSKMTLFPESLLSKILTTQYYQKVKGKAFKSLSHEIKKSKGKTYPDKADCFFMTNHVSRFTILGSVISRNYVEETMPTLDNEFIDVILRIPPEFRFRHEIYIKFLKHLAPRMTIIPCEATMVPPIAPLIFWRFGRKTISLIQKIKKMIWKMTKGRVLIRNRHGYIHVDEYIRINKKWRDVIYTSLLNKESEIYKNGIFKLEGVKKLMQEHESGKADHTQRITHILTFEIFLRNFS